MSSGANGSLPGLGPEARFLLAACSVDPESARATAEEVLATVFDAEVLEQGAWFNRVIPLTYELLQARGAADRSPYLHRFARQVRWINIFMIEELLQLTRLFEEHGLELMAYKGPVLAQQLYCDHAQRMHSDLDVIVREREVPRALELLRERGYEPESRDDSPPPPSLESLLERDCQLRLVRSAPEILLELHWHVFPRQHCGGIDIDELWDRSVSIDFPGGPLRTLSPEDTLLLLAIHGGDKHHWERLQMIADVARFVVRNPEIDWEILHAKARRMGHERTLLDGLGLAWVLLDAEVPPVLADRVRRPRTLSVAAAVLGYQFREDRGFPRYAEWKRYVEVLAGRAARREQPVDGSPGWPSYLAGALSLKWDDQPLQLPAALSFAYYVYRPMRLLAKHGRGLLRRI